MLLDGTVIGSFGWQEKEILGRYPAIRSFQEYEERYRSQRAEFGYYSRLSCFNNYVFRTCKLDGKTCWKLQVYERQSGDLVHDIMIPNNIEILGCVDDYYYAFVREDLENEHFILIRFKI